MKSRFIYSSKYDFSFAALNKLHPFDGQKFSKAWNTVSEKYKEAITSLTVEPVDIIADEKLLKVHTGRYLQSLFSSAEISRIIEIRVASIIPNKLLQDRLLSPVKLACTGTLMAAQLAVKEKLIAMNFGGGFHHAFSDHGEGFCFFGDAAISIVENRENGMLSSEDKVLVIDLDAHRGNGFEALVKHDPNVKIFDMYSFQVYPGLHEGDIDDFPYMIPLKAGTDGNAYMEILKAELGDFLDEYSDAKLVFYNAGNDILECDPLGGLKVSFEGVVERDKFVIGQLNRRQMPTVVMTSGGYTNQSYKLIAKLAETVLSVATR